MPDAFDLTELKAYLTKLAQAQGFLVDVQISDDDIELPGSKVREPHIHVSVHNTSKAPPLKVQFYVSVRQFERAGVHAFDVHMSDAFRSLSAL
jgi:hypothetical protein